MGRSVLPASYFVTSSAKVAARRGARRIIPGHGPTGSPVRCPTRRSTRSSRCSTPSVIGQARARPELVEHTGLGRAIVAQRVGELLERGLVTEGDVGPSTGGRPPRQLAFRAEAGHLLVADLGATSIDVAVTTLDGRILGHHDEPAHIEAGRSAAWSASTSCSSRCCARPRASPASCGGSASACRARSSSRPAGPSRRRSCRAGTATRSASASRPATARRSGSTTTSTCWPSASGARASPRATTTWSWSRSGRASGPGIISGGRVHRGAQGSAGDVGHIGVTEDPAVVCRCGNIGCLEALAGGAAIGRAGEAAALDGRSARLRTAWTSTAR